MLLVGFAMKTCIETDTKSSLFYFGYVSVVIRCLQKDELGTLAHTKALMCNLLTLHLIRHKGFQIFLGTCQKI